MSRSLEKTGSTVPDVCNSCFTEYCWNGTLDSRTPATYEPKVELAAIKLNSAAKVGAASMWLSMVVAAVMM